MKCIYLSLLLIILATQFGCNKEPITDSEPVNNPVAEIYADEEVLVRVNGVPITNHDVSYWLRGSHGQNITSEMKAKTLQRLVDAELIYQKGREVGLHRDSKYQNKVLKLELSLKATQRTEMTKRVYNMEVAAKVKVDSKETRDYFDANRERISRRLHLGMISFDDESRAGKVLSEIRAGKPFEVAAGSSRSSHSQSNRKKWDLGFMKWSRIPVAWHDVVYSLKPGEVSGVFKSKQAGLIIFKLLESQNDADVEFESVRTTIMNEVKETEDPMAYYTANRDRITRELHLAMILAPNENAAEEILAKIEAGESFESLAESIHPAPERKGSESWDLGFMKWSRIPLEWHDVVYSLAPGEVSEVFSGEQTGIRIFKLLEMEDDPSVEFNSVSNAIMNRLRDKKTREAYRVYLAELRRNAHIEQVSAQ